MADQKISELTALASADPLDVLPIVDTSVTETKKITFASMEGSIDHANILNTHNLTTDIDHDALTNFVANEHLDWTSDLGATNIHSGNIPDLSATYAVAAKGVTNGDSHDHSGGDGAQINHTTLSNIGTNTHAQIDTHIADTSDPHGSTLTQTTISAGTITITTDQDSDDAAYVPMILHGTDATPPAASGFTRGTLYVQYTA